MLWLRPAGSSSPAPSGERADRGGPALVVLPSRVDLLDPIQRPVLGISALRDPDGARSRVLACFRETFDLPEDPWEPGRGVLVGAPGRARLEELLADPSAARQSGLERLAVE